MSRWSAALLLVALAACDGERAATPDVDVGAAHGGAPSLDDLAAVGYALHEPNARGAGGADVRAPAMVAPGWNLYTDEHAAVLAVDRDGVERRRFVVPGRTRVTHAEPVAAGLLTVSVDEGWDLLAPDGTHRWSVDGNAHHDVAQRADGGYWALGWEERELGGRRVRFDLLLELGAEGGTPRVRWRSYDALRALHPPLPLDRAAMPGPEGDPRVYDYHHVNTLEELAAPGDASASGAARLLSDDPRFAPGYLLLCARNASLVFVLDPASGAVTWSFGPGTLDFPHTPTLTPDGTVLVFDNGWHRGWSRVLEVDPRDDSIRWSWRGSPPEAFFTRTRGSAQRLANGNTLVCEAERGRAFELTPAGEVVWSFRNPLEPGSVGGAPDPDGTVRRRIYRLTRVDPARLGGR